jgi:alpha-tubulin suppressor-like RCC1 family protein
MLGLGNDNSRNTPGNVSGEFTWKAGSLTAGGLHTCGIRSSNNAAYCWGRNPYGALGQGSVGNRNTPGLVLGGQTWLSVSAGDLQSCGINTAGARFCWGAAELNQLGLNSLVTQWQPTMLNGDTIVYGSVELGGGSGCALMSSPTRMRCWGTNEYGHAGTGSTAMAPAPVPVTTRAYTSLSSGGFHACAVAGTGTLYCWGHNESGQLGLNNTTRKLTPTAVTGMPAGAMTLSAGQAHTCALRSSDSTLYCWGANTYGQVGIGSTATKVLVPTQLA